MSSFVRRLQRKAARQRSDYEPAPQPTVMKEDGGYKTLRPTKGWIEFAAIRIAAQMALARILERDIPIVRNRKPRKVWRPDAPVPPSVETRQQRRWAARRAG